MELHPLVENFAGTERLNSGPLQNWTHLSGFQIAQA
jgi:hypothetical protein